MVIFHSYVKLPEGIIYPFVDLQPIPRVSETAEVTNRLLDCFRCPPLFFLFLGLLRRVDADQWSASMIWWNRFLSSLIFLPALSHDSSGNELRSLYKVWESAFSSAQTPKVMPDPIASTTFCPSKSCMSHIDTHSMFWWEVEQTNHNKSPLLFLYILYQKVNL